MWINYNEIRENEHFYDTLYSDASFFCFLSVNVCFEFYDYDCGDVSALGFSDAKMVSSIKMKPNASDDDE